LYNSGRRPEKRCFVPPSAGQGVENRRLPTASARTSPQKTFSPCRAVTPGKGGKTGYFYQHILSIPRKYQSLFTNTPAFPQFCPYYYDGYEGNIYIYLYLFYLYISRARAGSGQKKKIPRGGEEPIGKRKREVPLPEPRKPEAEKTKDRKIRQNAEKKKTPKKHTNPTTIYSSDTAVRKISKKASPKKTPEIQVFQGRRGERDKVVIYKNALLYNSGELDRFTTKNHTRPIFRPEAW